MHIHTCYSRSSASDYLDTESSLAIDLSTEVHQLFTHSFQIANDNGFEFCGYPLGRLRTNGHIRVLMSIFYPPTSTLLETLTDITPAMSIDVQLVTCLLSLMTDSCPEKLFHHLCCTTPAALNLIFDCCHECRRIFLYISPCVHMYRAIYNYVCLSAYMYIYILV